MFKVEDQFEHKDCNQGETACLALKGNKICLPAPAKLTNLRVISCLFNSYKNQNVKTINFAFAGSHVPDYFSAWCSDF